MHTDDLSHTINVSLNDMPSQNIISPDRMFEIDRITYL